MTEEAQRVAIAEACGWKHIDRITYNDGVHGCPPYARIGEPGMEQALLLPNYPHSLDAMHEAEKIVLTFSVIEGVTELQSAYIKALWSVLGKPDANRVQVLTHATAAQRAEAFLRTLNLWDDTK